MTAFSVIAGVIVLAAGLALGMIDHDAGGYVDQWNTTGRFPDKAVHAVCAVALTLALAQLGSIAYAVAVTVAAGLLLELGQSQRGGFFSKWDLAADIAGALLAAGFLLIIHGAMT